MLRVICVALFCLAAVVCFAQTDNDSSTPKVDSYQIYLRKPAKEIREIKNHKTCEPINGTLSEGGKKIKMHDYEPGSKVYIQVIYMDGTEEEIIRSPCFIDPVI